MAKGARAPSHNAYRGSIGRTRSRAVHVTAPDGDLIVATATVAIDAVADPELVARLHAGTLNVVEFDGGGTLAVAVPVVYHDPAAELLVLVLGDGDRHRELAERIRLLEELRDDGAHVPAYAKEFAVVFGAAGLAAYLERRVADALVHVEAQRETERRRAEIAELRGELDRLRAAAPVTASAPPPAAPPPAAPHVAHHLRNDPPTDQIAISQAKIDRTRQPLDAGGLRQALTDDDLAPPAEVREHDHDQPSRRTAREASTMRVELVELIDDDRAPGGAAAAPPPPRPASHNDATIIAMAPQGRPTTAPVPVVASPPIAPSVPPPPPPAPPVPPPPPAPSAHRSIGEDFDKVTTDVRSTAELSRMSPLDASRVEIDEERTAQSLAPIGTDPLTTQTVELPGMTGAGLDPWLELAATGAASSFTVDAGGARLGLLAGDALARQLAGALDVRLLLYRLPSYPVVALVIGSPIAFRAPNPSQLAVVPLDVGVQLDRELIGALAGAFELRVDVIKRGKPMRAVSLLAPLAENAGYVLRAAEDHLRGLSADGSTPGFERSRDVVLAPGFDLLGVGHPEAIEFRDDKLAQLDTAQQLRRAVAMARRFARPSREDYLVCTRGFPIARWHELRRHVVKSAVTWGIWMGPELAQVAVSEGFARSRRDLIVRLDAGFDALRRHPTAFDIDQDAADDNLAALADEAKALGVELRKSLASRNGHIASDDVVAVAGSIERTPTAGIPRGRPTEELIGLLGDRTRRVAAALELCERADPRAAAPVIEVVQALSRAEAVRVLGTAVRFGAAAAPPLLAGLRSNKAFLRHGCALALAMLRTEEGTQAVIELLLEEPTEVWREIARAVGQIGVSALMPLAAHAGRLGDRLTPVLAERVAWAMAHIAVRGGKPPLEALAAGHSGIAPVARKALELVDTAATDHTIVRNTGGAGDPPRDVTVNRAFSRRFFEALDQNAPLGQAPGGGAGHRGELSSPMETLDESDLIADDEEALDASDLIQP